MKHTSIRLSEAHAEKIEQTGQSPTTIIKRALDLYFDIPADALEPAQKLIYEHIRLYHCAQPEHMVSTDKHIVPQGEHKPRAQCEHTSRTDEAHSAHDLSTEARTALSFILSELEAGREPTSREAAEKVGLTPTGLGMMLSKVGIKAQNTRRDMKSVKIFTRPMIARIKEILGE